MDVSQIDDCLVTRDTRVTSTSWCGDWPLRQLTSLNYVSVLPILARETIKLGDSRILGSHRLVQDNPWCDGLESMH